MFLSSTDASMRDLPVEGSFGRLPTKVKALFSRFESRVSEFVLHTEIGDPCKTIPAFVHELETEYGPLRLE